MHARRRLLHLPPDSRPYRGRHQKNAQLDIDLFRVKRIDCSVFQSRVGENAVHCIERKHCVGKEVHLLPPPASDLKPEIGSDDGEDENVQRGGTERIDSRLFRRIHRIEEIHQSEALSRREENERWMYKSQE